MGQPLLGLLFISFPLGIALIWVLPRARWTRYIALATSCFSLIVTLAVAVNFDPRKAGFQFVVDMDWMPDLGINYTVGVDGISVLFLPTTALLFVGVMLISWKHLCVASCKAGRIREASGGRLRVYYSLLLLLEAATLGVFCSMNVILFFLFWELTLIPIFLLIRIWGVGSERHQAAVQYTLVMIAGGVPLLFGFLVLASHAGWAFDLPTLLAVRLAPNTEKIVFLLLLLGFGVKVPFPLLHTWLPLIAMEGPIAATSLMLGLKIGVYGVIRFAIPLAPHAAQDYHWLLAGLGTTALIGGLVALVQTDLRRMLAYASFSHVGLVILGIASFDIKGMQGAILQLLNFTIASGGSFLLMACLYSRFDTTDHRALGGVAHTMPLLASLFLLLGFASIGMPCTSGFPGELLILLSVFKFHTGAGIIALLSMVVSAAYFLGLYRRVFFGGVTQATVGESADLRPRELVVGLSLSFIVLAVGLFPGWLLDFIRPTAEAWVMRLQ